jgi:hypothetical protein
MLDRDDEAHGMSFDLYVWKAPRDLDPDAAAERLAAWEDAGADPSAAPFEPSDDVGWFYVELLKDRVGIEAVSDGVADSSSRPIWLTTDPAAPARIVAMRLSPTTSRDDLDIIYGLATKYDLVLFDPIGPGLHLPLADMAEYATATFWPRGAIQAFVAGSVGAAVVVISWILGIPILSWIGIIIGGFLFVMAVYTFIHEGRELWRRRGSSGVDGAS